VNDALRASEGRLDRAITEQARARKSAFESYLRERLAEHGSSLREATTEAMGRLLEGTSAKVGDRLRSVDSLVMKLQQQVADLVDWKIRIQQEADQMRRDIEAAKRREPVKPEVAPKKTPDPKAEPSPAKEDEQRLQEIERWRKRLRDADEDVVFSATIQLAHLKALEAAPDLLRVLEKHKKFYPRLGAATALGEIQAVDAVPALIEALNDKDDLVRTAASEALHLITGQDFNFVSGLTKNERIRVMKKWRAWWRDNETGVRRKLEQPVK